LFANCSCPFGQKDTDAGFENNNICKHVEAALIERSKLVRTRTLVRTRPRLAVPEFVRSRFVIEISKNRLDAQIHVTDSDGNTHPYSFGRAIPGGGQAVTDAFISAIKKQ